MSWRHWLKSLLAAAIAGAGQGMAALAIGISLNKALLLIGVSGVIGVGLYLKQSPLPNGNGGSK